MRAFMLAAVASLSGAAYAQPAQIDLVPAFRSGLEHAIRDEGYECPRAKLAHAMGPGARGQEVLVQCGKNDGGDTLDGKLVYKVSIRRDGGTTVVIWHGDPYRTH